MSTSRRRNVNKYNSSPAFAQGGAWGVKDGTIKNSTHINDFITQGSLPDSLLPITNRGGFGDIAHQAKKDKMMMNLLNNDVDTQVLFTLKNPITGEPRANITFRMNGKVYRSDANGDVRIADDGVLEFRRTIAAHRKERIERAIQYLNDDQDDAIAPHIFGIPFDKWKAACKKNDAVKYRFQPGTYDEGNTVEWMQKELNNIDCSMAMIKTYGVGEKDYRLAMQKLYLIVEALEPNMQLERFTDPGEFTKNMHRGSNVPEENVDEKIYKAMNPPAA